MSSSRKTGRALPRESLPRSEDDLWDRQQQSLAADLARRDFTINSFALDLQDPTVLDPHSGLDDLAARRLRATTELSFSGDPLRVMRLARFGGQLGGFTVVRETLELAQRAVPQLEKVPPERIREELRLLFGHQGCAEAFSLLEQLGVYPTLWTGRSRATRETTAAGAGLDRFDHASRWLEQMAPDSQVRSDPFTGRMAVLFDTASRAAHRTAIDLLQDQQATGHISKRDAQRIARLLRWQELPVEEGSQRWLLHEMGELWPTLACCLATRGETPMDEGEWRRLVTGLTRLAAEQGHEIFAPAALLSGTEIQKLLDIPPGPRVGEIASRLRRLQVEGRISSRSAAEKTVLELGSVSEDVGSEV
jgi:poly(A) polymerase